MPEYDQIRAIILETKEDGGLKNLGDNEKYLIILEEPFLFFNLVSSGAYKAFTVLQFVDPV